MISQNQMTKRDLIHISPVDDSFPLKNGWIIKEGKYFKNFLSKIPKEIDSALVSSETKNILSSFPNPSKVKKFKSTGCVIGYVQSGKTTSFNALSSLALDNGYKFIIVLAGRSNMLIDQNKKEFEKLFLNVDSCKVMDSYKNVNCFRTIDFSMLREDKYDPAEKIILVINKHQTHIENLTAEIKNYYDIFNECPTLIIDDEADHAGLNTEKDNKNYSKIYSAISALRKSLPMHSVAQYTATPQALLMISKKDPYSPEFVKFISPGEKYIGTKEVFDKNSSIVSIIPGKDALVEKPDITDTLETAIFHFLIACSESTIKPEIFTKSDGKTRVSMMIHPSVSTDLQNDYAAVLKDYFESLISSIEFDETRFFKDHNEIILEEYNNIKKNNKDISSFKEIYERIPYIIKKIKIHSLNSDQENEVDFEWKNVGRFNILIGGYKLDRGFVVKGLTTTYMERGLGISNMDSIQQRGRFYGYKRDHKHFLKVWLVSDIKKAFENYVETEETLYNDLKSFNELGKPLKEWRRRFLLNPELNICRKNIVRLTLFRNLFKQNGFFSNENPIDFKENHENFEKLIKDNSDKFKSYPNQENWSDETKCLIAEDLSLREILKFLDNIHINYDSNDKKKLSAAQITLSKLADEKYRCSLILIGTNSLYFNEFYNRKRTVDERKKISKLFQGKTISSGFPGHEKIFSRKNKTVTLQIHRLLNRKNGEQFFALAIKIPDKKNMMIEYDDLSHLYHEGVDY